MTTLEAPWPRSDLTKAIQRMKTQKAADECGLVAELLKHVPEDVLTKLLTLMNDLLLSGELPQTWQKTVLQMLPKTAKAMVTSDYRPIANVRVLYKLFIYLVLGRTDNTLDCAQPEEQHGFRKNRRIEEHLVTANYVFDKTMLLGTPLWLISLDLSKAFDRVDWQALWKALETHGVSEHLISILQLLYDNQRGQVITDTADSREFDIRRGVRQGCVLSPRLFCLVLEWALDKWRMRVRTEGIDLENGGDLLLDLRFADDILVFATSSQQAAYLLDELVVALADVGLILNQDNTKLLTTQVQLPKTITTPGGLSVRLDSGHLFLGSTPLSPAAGVGILLHERHVSKLKLVKQISLRLMFADLVLSHGTVRFVAAYAPHSGYSRDVLDKFYEDLHACLEDARGKRFQLVVGGDFNTQLNTGFRGTLLQDVGETFDLIITNDDDNHICNMDTWTFESSRGLRRRIDFIMCSQEMRFFFFLRTFFRVCLWLCMTVLLGSLQAHDWHEGHEGQKSRAQVCLGRGGEATGGRRVWRGFRQELAPVDGIGVDVVEIGCSFTKKGGCEGGHGCMGQRSGPSCGESGRNALLEDGGSAHATCNLDLGSDHRAVTVSLDLGFRRRGDRKCFRCVKRWKPPLGPESVPHAYHAILQEELGVKKPTTLNRLEDVLQQSVRRINTTSKLPKPKPVWQDAVQQDLLQRRRAAHDRSERATHAAMHAFAASLLDQDLSGCHNLEGNTPSISEILAEVTTPPHYSRLPAPS